MDASARGPAGFRGPRPRGAPHARGRPRRSDSAMLDEAWELLIRGGRDFRHAATMLVPGRMESLADVDADLVAILPLPRDAPGALGWPGRRSSWPTANVSPLARSEWTAPLRITICEDGLVRVRFGGGVVDTRVTGRVRRGKLGPGQTLCVDPAEGGGCGKTTIKAL